MTFESLAVAGLSLGLSMENILEFNIGLSLGLLNEQHNQFIEAKKRNSKKQNKDEEETVVEGDAKMLMKM